VLTCAQREFGLMLWELAMHTAYLRILSISWAVEAQQTKVSVFEFQNFVVVSKTLPMHRHHQWCHLKLSCLFTFLVLVQAGLQWVRLRFELLKIE
jgi:hypothetical protein